MIFDRKRKVKYAPVVAFVGKRGMYRGESSEYLEVSRNELRRLRKQDFEHEDALFRVEKTTHVISYIELDIDV